MKLFWLGLALVLVAVAASYFFLFHRPNPPLSADVVKIGKTAFRVELATSTVAQARGLSFRPSLAAGTGMLFLFSAPRVQNFWMKDMNFPIDIIWIGGDKVLGFVERATPQPGAPIWKLTIYNSPDGTDKVLEVNAGEVARYGIKEGDTITL